MALKRPEVVFLTGTSREQVVIARVLKDRYEITLVIYFAKDNNQVVKVSFTGQPNQNEAVTSS